MARPVRIEYEGAFYHVTARGNERGKVFFAKADYQKFKEYLREGQAKYGFILHCYVLMTNHYHLLIETPEKNLSKIMHHSSYSAYTGENDGLVRTTDLLAMFSKNTKVAKQKYKIFVESALGEKQESPMKKVYGGMILGSVPFIKETLNRLEEGLLQRTETSHKKALRSPCEIDDVLSHVAAHYVVTPEIAVSAQRNDIRKVVIYLMKKQSAASNQEIGKAVGGMSGFAVAKAYQRLKMEMVKDGVLRKEFEALAEKLSRVNG